MTRERNYRVTCDPLEFLDIVLTYDEYKDQPSRDKVRQKIAEHHGIPRHYLRLTQYGSRVAYNPKTGKDERHYD